MARPRSGHSGAPCLLGRLARAEPPWPTRTRWPVQSQFAGVHSKSGRPAAARAGAARWVTSFTDGMCAMNSRSGRKTRLMAAVVGGGAVVAVGALSASLTPMSGANEADSDIVNVASTTAETTPPAAPSIAEAVPAIRGPAPLYAGQAPNANPQ